MHEIYERLEKEGKIGPKEMKDGKLVFKERKEYPKRVSDKFGNRVTVKSLQEEMEVIDPNKKSENDPLQAEKTKLLEQSAEFERQRKEMEEVTERMKAKLAEFEKGEKKTEEQKAVSIAQEVRKTEGPLVKTPEPKEDKEEAVKESPLLKPA